MSIVGAPFLPYVKDQIKVRQQVLGKTSLNSQDLTWINSKTSWIKLASSVNIESQVVKAPNEQGQVIDVYNSGSEIRQSLLEITNYGGNRLAQEMVLQAGVLNSSNGNLKFGVSENNTTLPSNPSNYGFGGSEFGLVPMPGITGFEVKTYNNGTLREATVNITAFNRVSKAAGRRLKRKDLVPFFFEAMEKNWLCLASPVLSNLATVSNR